MDMSISAVNLKADKKGVPLDPLEKWVYNLYQKKGMNKAAVALANKNSRVAWALIAHDRQYDERLTSCCQQKDAA